MIAEEAYVLSKSFTNNSIKGITGTLAGKNCTIKSTTKADGVTTVVFAWTADDGTEKTTTIQVNDGAKGDIGIGIDNVTINANSHLIVTLSDGSTIDAGLIQGGSGTDDYEDLINRPKIEGVDLIGNKTFEDLGVASATDLAQTNGHLQDKVDKTDIATELSDASTDDEVVGALTAYNELQKLESANKEQFPTASGNYITVTDSVDGKLVELGVKGNSFQKTYSGKNLLVYPYTDTTKVNSGVTFTDNGDGSVTINGTNTTNQWLYFWLFGSSASDESKRENLYGKQLIISGLKNDVGNIKLESYYKTTDDKEYWIRPTGDDDDYFTITYPSKSEVALMNLAIVIYPNGVINNVTVKPMIRLATETDSTYEPYVGAIPSPNPSYPQTINSVGDDGSLVVTSCGKNLAKNTNLSTSHTSREVTFVTKSDGTIVVNGTPTQATDNWVWCTGNSNFLLRKGKYLWTGCPTNDGSNKYRLLLRNVEKPWKENNDYGNGVTFELTEDKAFCFFVGISYGYVANNLTFKPMLRKCDDNWIPYGDDLYEPYKETTTTIPLSEPLRSIGDIKDEITYQDGKWGVLRRIGSVAYDGSDDENWTLGATDNYNDTTFTAYINSPIKPIPYGGVVFKPIPSVCDRFKQSSINLYPNSIDYECHMVSNTSDEACASFGRLSIRLLKSRVTEISIDAVKAFIASNPFTVNYQLRNPEFEPFADQTLPYLSTYDGVTNISNNDALSAEMTVKYPTTDASGVGSRNESSIVDIEGTVGSTDISDIGDGTITNAISMMSSKLGGLTFSASGTTLSITDGTNTWTLEANS